MGTCCQSKLKSELDELAAAVLPGVVAADCGGFGCYLGREGKSAEAAAKFAAMAYDLAAALLLERERRPKAEQGANPQLGCQTTAADSEGGEP